MKIKLQFNATVEKKEKTHVLNIVQKDTFKKLLAQMEGKKVILTIDPVKRTRSLNQNSYWWGVCYPILADATGHTIPEVHEICKTLFIVPKTIQIDPALKDTLDDILTTAPESVAYERSTTELSVGEGIEYTDMVRRLAQELGTYIPSPEEAGYTS